MFGWFKHMIVRLFRRRRPGRAPDVDPFVGVRVPRRREPGGRGSAVALEEPEPTIPVEALGRLFRKKQ